MTCRSNAKYGNRKVTAHGQTVVEDTKGVRTKEYILKRKMMLFFHGIVIKEV